ncbi:MAG: thioredoxin family protein [Candidatus Poribacteria bacterium]|nr:thioredoxin family protein [Candidatus Poribacteria bacterium]
MKFNGFRDFQVFQLSVFPKSVQTAEAVLSAYDNISLRVVDVRQNRQRARQMEIYAVPTFVFNDEVIYVGSPTMDELDAKLQELTNLQDRSCPELT